MTRAIHICRFDTASHLRGAERTYENIKLAVLQAGSFSVFDVETKADAAIFERLVNDPDIETFKMLYPWIGVRAVREESE